MEEAKIYWTVDEAAEVIGVSGRWLADQCRAETVEHVHIARKRRFTREQVEKLGDRFTTCPPDVAMLDSDRARVIRQVARSQNRRARSS